MIRAFLHAALLVPVTLRAQSELTIDATSARMRFADTLDATALSLSPALHLVAPRASLRAYGTLSRLASGWSNSGTIDGVVSTPTRAGLSAELEGVAGGSAHSDGTTTGQMIGFARLQLSGADRGLWVGAGAGRTQAQSWHPLVQGDLGAWYAGRGTTLGLSIAPTSVDDTIRFVDASALAHHEEGRWELEGSLGVRTGAQLPSLPADHKVWGSGAATLWLTPKVGVVARAGTYPVDFTQGFPGGQFVSVSIRLRSVRSTTSAAGTTAALPGARRLTVDRVGPGDTHRLRVYAPAARSVDLMGDFTAWTPVSLSAAGGGWWTVTLDIPRGTHQVNLRTDGGAWTVPPGTTPLKDEFGGVVGLLVIS